VLACLGYACVDDAPPADSYAGCVGAVLRPDGGLDCSPPVALSEKPDAAADDFPSVVQPAPGLDGGAGATAPGTDAGTQAPSSPAAAPGACDISGKWVSTEHTVMSGLGVRQAPVTWRYYELAQSGDQVTVQRGLYCGGRTTPIDALGIAATYNEAAWPYFIKYARHDGRRAVAKPAGAKCAVSFEKHVAVTGMSADYADGRPLPTASEQGGPGKAGWLDWDDDGFPGYANHLNGIASGTIHVCSRNVTTYSGTVASVAKSFKLYDDWKMEIKVLAIEGSELLGSQGVRDSDDASQYIVFTRVTDDQVAAPDENALCAKVRALAPQLQPDANR
jgi:hypothetical protein